MYKGVIRSPITVILLSIITCGIYGLYWLFTVGKEINTALGRPAVNTVLMVVSLFCFPIILLYWHSIDKGLIELGDKKGVSYKGNFILWLLLMLLGFGSIVMMYQTQDALNDMWAKDAPNA